MRQAEGPGQGDRGRICLEKIPRVTPRAVLLAEGAEIA